MGEIIVGIDIGTSKVCALVGRIDDNNHFEIIGKGLDSCAGLKKGVIVDIDATSKSIKNSVKQAETMANLKIGSAYVNIIGSHVSLIPNRSSVSVLNDNREISYKDVERVLTTAADVDISEDMQVIDIVPKQYIVDSFDEIIDPVGMVGSKLEVEANVVTGNITSVQNILRSMKRAELKVDGLVVETLATSEIVLTPDEKEMGVILLDIGGGVTDVSVYKNKSLVFYNSLPVGGDHITNDISIGLKIPYSEAEKIKREYELALTSLIKNDQEVYVNEFGNGKRKTVRVSEIVEIIEARVFEILSLCKRMLDEADIRINSGAGIVLTGGGISYVDGSLQLTEEVFGLPTRIASYKIDGISNLEYATAAGIVKHVALNRKGEGLGSEVVVHKSKQQKKEFSFFKKLSRLLNDFLF